jgi:His/Glu/Gln/Arg/opine family amino acid ABC transporter permease subunit
MALAVIMGVAIAVGRVYGNRGTRIALTAYVELMRGTPVLLQLFVIYYGLSAVVRLPAFLAALVGLGLNYAAYESEIYRSSLEAVPKGQIEAARILGFSDTQILRLIRGPQAFRLALAPMTNDFVALLKDSSLVSVITVVELTKHATCCAASI